MKPTDTITPPRPLFAESRAASIAIGTALVAGVATVILCLIGVC
jgi:hypothetical protein